MSHAPMYQYGARHSQPQVVGYPYGAPTVSSHAPAPASHAAYPYNHHPRPVTATQQYPQLSTAHTAAPQQLAPQQVRSHHHNVHQQHPVQPAQHMAAPQPAVAAPAPAQAEQQPQQQQTSTRPQINVPDVIEDKSLMRLGCGIKRYQTGKCIGRVRSIPCRCASAFFEFIQIFSLIIFSFSLL